MSTLEGSYAPDDQRDSRTIDPPANRSRSHDAREDRGDGQPPERTGPHRTCGGACCPREDPQSGARALGGCSQPGRRLRTQALRGASTTASETYEDLFFRVEQLEHRIRLLEGRYTASSPEEPFEADVPS